MKRKLRIRELAEARGWNQTKLMRAADINSSTAASIWKDPYRVVRSDVLVKIAEALEVNIDDLFEKE